MLLTAMNNMGSTTLISTVVINREQVVRFLLCRVTSLVHGQLSSASRKMQ